MTIGDRYLIDTSRYNQFIHSGLVHLIAVSGGNIAIVVLFFGTILFWVPFYVRQGILIIVTVCYAMIVGNDSSILRATVM
jgi:competence protein ComEC